MATKTGTGQKSPALERFEEMYRRDVEVYEEMEKAHPGSVLQEWMRISHYMSSIPGYAEAALENPDLRECMDAYGGEASQVLDKISSLLPETDETSGAPLTDWARATAACIAIDFAKHVGDSKVVIDTYPPFGSPNGETLLVHVPSHD